MRKEFIHKSLRIGRYFLVTVASTCGLLAATSAQIQAQWMPTSTKAHIITNALSGPMAQDYETIEIVVGLKLRNIDQLAAVRAAQLTPNDPQFGQWLAPADVLADYAPTAADAQAVASYLGSKGFTNIQIAANRLLVSATGTVGAVQSAFNTRIAHFTRNGRDAIANLDDASVPSELSSIVLSVLGLQTLDQAHIEIVEGHDPVQFPIAYDASSLVSASSTAVGIITEGSMTQTITDLHAFEVPNGLPIINPTVVNVGGSSGDTSGLIEWDLDSQDIQAQAGGTVRQMLFYTATSFNNGPLTQTYNQVVTDDIATVTNVSLGECETANYNDGSMAQDDQIFELAVAQGQLFSVASGDSGSNQCGSGGVSYPASSSYVIAVGGTTLSTNADNTYASETAWSGSGGGPSAYEAQPSWQAGVVPGTQRGVPDIAFDADPNSGAYIWENAVLLPSPVGGTSLASPLFVGAWARIQTAHGNALGFPAPWIYQYGATPPASAFHDVTSGSNGAYSARVGWDYVTGFGSFDVAAVNSVIQTVPISPGAPPAPANITADVNVDCPRIQITWWSVSGATYYDLFQESSSSGWVGDGGLIYSGTATQRVVATGSGANYLWKVRSCNANACSALSGATASGHHPSPCP